MWCAARLCRAAHEIRQQMNVWIGHHELRIDGVVTVVCSRFGDKREGNRRAESPRASPAVGTRRSTLGLVLLGRCTEKRETGRNHQITRNGDGVVKRGAASPRRARWGELIIVVPSGEYRQDTTGFVITLRVECSLEDEERC